MDSSILKNYKIKIVVIIIAIFIWFFVETENNYKYSFEIPIQITNLSPGKIITNEKPNHVKATLWGKGRELLALILSRKLQYNFDLTNVNESRLFIFDKKNVRFPHASNIEILNIIEPDSVYLKIENLEHKKVPVKTEIRIIPIQGYIIVNGIQLQPDSVCLTGAKTGLDSVSYIRTEQLVYKEVKRDLKKKIKLINPEVKNVWPKQSELYFFADVQKILEKPIAEIPIKIVNKPSQVEVIVIPSSLNLTLIGGVDLLLPITNMDIPAYIDYLKVRDSKEKYHLAYINKPDGVRIKDIKPKRFKVIVKKNSSR